MHFIQNPTNRSRLLKTYLIYKNLSRAVIYNYCHSQLAVEWKPAAADSHHRPQSPTSPKSTTHTKKMLCGTRYTIEIQRVIVSFHAATHSNVQRSSTQRVYVNGPSCTFTPKLSFSAALCSKKRTRPVSISTFFFLFSKRRI